MRSRSFLDAALAVLSQTERPMTSLEITAEALRQGLISATGKTPEATMSARLYRAIHKNPNASVVRVAEEGPTRARRGTVKWALRDTLPRHDHQPCST